MFLVFAGNNPPIGGMDDVKLVTPDFMAANDLFHKLRSGVDFSWGNIVVVTPDGKYEMKSSFEKGAS